jgi:exodeoxyribonuclease V alpha subunit
MDREHGLQFRAERMTTAHPATPEGIERYLASGAVRSVGPAIAKKIVALYAEKTLEVIEEHPEKLLDVHGIGQGRLAKIKASWQEQKAVRQIMLFLHSYGIGSARAVRIYKTYGEAAVETIRSDPYRLADDVRGIGFKTADELARKLGLDPHSPQRARAAVTFALQDLTGEGHAGYPEEGVVERTAGLVEVRREVIEAAVEERLAAGAIVREEHEDQRWLFLAGLHGAEVGLTESVRRLSAGEDHPLPPIDVEAAIGWVESRIGLELAPSSGRPSARPVARSSW